MGKATYNLTTKTGSIYRTLNIADKGDDFANRCALRSRVERAEATYGGSLRVSRTANS